MDSPTALHEVTPLMGKNVLYISDRHKKDFSYPIHSHEVYELNFVEHAPGVRRIVGDNDEVIGDYDLVLITSPNLEHVWEQGTCKSNDIHEITIQFDLDLSDSGIFGRNPFNSMKQMMVDAQCGVCFSLEAIMRVYNYLITLSQQKDGFYAFTQFLTILYELSRCPDNRKLSSNSYARIDVATDSRRIMKVKNFIAQNYSSEIRLNTLADIAGMSDSAFSRFFKSQTGSNISDYIIDLRLNNAIRQLLDAKTGIAEIGYSCGFNNLSNFNRIFKKKKGCSPSEYRENYHKTRIII